MDENPSYNFLRKSFFQKTLFILLFGAIIISLFYVFRYYLWPFIFALMLFMTLSPLQDRLLKRMNNRWLASLAVILIFFFVLIIPLFFLLISLGDQSYQLYLFLENHINADLMKSIENSSLVKKAGVLLNISVNEIIARAVSLVQEFTGKLFANITRILSFPISLSIDFIFMMLILFFLLKDGYRLESGFYELLPFPEDLEKKVVTRLKGVVKILLAGNLIIMLLQGFFLGLGFYFAGIRMPLLWGSVAAIFSIIPVIGTLIIWGPAVIFCALSGYYFSAVFAGIWCLCWYLILENLVKPVVFGDRLNFHPLLFFFLLLGSLKTFGIQGVIIGPILLTLFYSFLEIYRLIFPSGKDGLGSQPDKPS